MANKTKEKSSEERLVEEIQNLGRTVRYVMDKQREVPSVLGGTVFSNLTEICFA